MFLFVEHLSAGFHWSAVDLVGGCRGCRRGCLGECVHGDVISSQAIQDTQIDILTKHKQLQLSSGVLQTAFSPKGKVALANELLA